MIDLSRFSLNKTQVEIQRFEGTYVNGIFTRVLVETRQAWASVQPYDTSEPASQFEPEGGSWPREKYLMYIREVIYLDDVDSDHPVADKILCDGVFYEPIRVQKWLHLRNPHYKVLMQKWDGN